MAEVTKLSTRKFAISVNSTWKSWEKIIIYDKNMKKNKGKSDISRYQLSALQDEGSNTTNNMGELVKSYKKFYIDCTVVKKGRAMVVTRLIP